MIFTQDELHMLAEFSKSHSGIETLSETIVVLKKKVLSQNRALEDNLNLNIKVSALEKQLEEMNCIRALIEYKAHRDPSSQSTIIEITKWDNILAQEHTFPGLLNQKILSDIKLLSEENKELKSKNESLITTMNEALDLIKQLRTSFINPLKGLE